MKTRGAILRAAMKAFAAKGYRGASIADIASVAKVQKSLVQYHFGTKEQLWNACLAERAKPMIPLIDQVLRGQGELADLLAARFRFLRDNPDMFRLLAWASMSSAPIPEFLLQRRDGIINQIGTEHHEERMARLLFVLSATDGWLLFRNLYRGLIGEEILSPGIEQKLIELISEVAPSNG